jgi:TIR domain
MRTFISYARQTSSDAANRLAGALAPGNDKVFLDRAAIELSAEFPAAIIEALLDAQLFIVLLDSAYVTRWYCLRELQIAVAARERARAAGEDAPALLVVLGDGVTDEVLLALPPDLRSRNWAGVNDIESVVRAAAQMRDAAGVPPFGKYLTRFDPSVLALSESPRIPQLVKPDVPVTGDVVPSRGAFYGRADELWQMHQHLSVVPSTTGAGTATMILEGHAGVGKSQLAAEYVHRFNRSFPGGIFWLEAGVSLSDFELQVTELAQRVTGLDPRNMSDPRRRLMEWAAGATSPMLLVVDNVPQGRRDAATSSLAYWCPLIGVASVLATSRDRLARYEKDVRGLEVLPLSPDAAIAMITAAPVEFSHHYGPR